MIKVISDIGYCFGVKNAIKLFEIASKENKHVYLLHPLLHNIKENDLLMKNNNASYFDNKFNKDDALFSAHGYLFDDIDKFKNKLNTYIGTCPLIIKRYNTLKNYNPDLYYVFLGKKDHQETISFIKNFPFLHLIDINKDINEQLENLNITNKNIFFICQTTISNDKYKECLNILNKNNIVKSVMPICDIYYKRIIQIDNFLSTYKNDAFLFIIGDNLSSNANEIKNFVSNKFKNITVDIINDISKIKKYDIQNKDIFLTSATSTSTTLFNKIKKEIEIIYNS